MARSNYFLKLALLCLVLIVQFSKAQENAVVVDVPELGSIRGVRVNNTAGVFREYIQFAGIPYAKSPEGEGRFLPAVETGPLVEDGEVFDATMPGEFCVQSDGFSILNPKSQDLAVEYVLTGDERIPLEYEEKSRQNGRAFQGTEDCLNLNIHTPRIEGRKLPVIVFIHGGSFTSGNGYSYGPGTFIQHNVVLVTINYRLGVLGFFSLETDDAPGNAALYDMLSALKWVSTYIEHFGGDPNSITVMGQSAGGAGVSHLMMSPLSYTPKPLFHKAIILSASALLPWATIDSPIKSSLRIAELAGCYFQIPIPSRERDPELYEEIIQCMKSTSADTLVNALNLYQAEERQAGRLGFDPVTPLIQKAGINKIITKKPLDVLMNGEQMDIPLIMGAVRHEGSYSLGVTYNRFLNCENCGQLQNNPTFLKSNLVPTILRSMGINDDTGIVYDIIANEYLGDRRNSGNFTLMTPGLIDIQSVFLFKSGAYKNLELHAQKNPNSYWYTFDHKGQYSMFPFMFPHPLPPIPGGVTHGDDILYLFPYFALNAVDRDVSNSLVTYYRNFAYTGNPNIHPIGGLESKTNAFVRWPVFDATTREHLVLNKEITVRKDYELSWTDVSLELEPQPITEPPTAEPTTEATTEPATAEPPTTQPPAVPTTAEPPTTQPPALPTTIEPPTTQPPAVPTTVEPQTTQPPAVPTTVEPQTTQPPAVPTTVEPQTTQPPAVPTTAEPPTTQPPAEPTTPEDNGSSQNGGQIMLTILTASLVMINFS